MTPNEQRDAFLMEVARGRTISEALVVAGYDLKSASARMAQLYLKSEEGQDALSRLRIQQTLARGDAKSRTSDDVIRDLREVYGLAVGSGDLKNALRALELEGKHRGTFADKIEISGKVDVVNTILAARKRVSLSSRDIIEDAQVVETPAIEDFG